MRAGNAMGRGLAGLSRRGLFGGAASVAAASSAAANPAAAPDPAITELPDGTRYLGDGVDARP